MYNFNQSSRQNKRQNKSQSRRAPKLTAILMISALSLFSLACPAVDPEELPPEEERVSGIQPPPLFLPALKSLAGQGPPQGGAVASVGNAEIQFLFDTSDAKYGAIFIFSAQPTVSADGTSISNLTEFCITGASNMAGHVWDHRTQILATTALASQFYACQINNAEPLSQTTRVPYGAGAVGAHFQAGTTYFWVVLGYDQYYRLTHSSPLYEFNTP